MWPTLTSRGATLDARRRLGVKLPRVPEHKQHIMHLPPLFQPGERILFQGDSITDGNRGRNEDPNHILGHGYVFLIAAAYGARWPEKNLDFLNRGVAGNRTVHLMERWQEDTLDLHPTLLSIMIGINDANGRVPAAECEAQLDQLLHRTRQALPALKLVLCEPFTLPGKEHERDWEEWRADVALRQAATARLAQSHNAILVPFQSALEAACQRAPVPHWLWDTIHPTYSGHQILAECWIETVARALAPIAPRNPA